jgi:uncharacterized membrane-anchored protein
MNVLWTRVITLLGAVAVLGGVGYSIHAKEGIIKSGAVIYLALAPVDPRSLMQGDYMALHFALADEIEQAQRDTPSAHGSAAAIVLDGRRVARLATAGAGSTLRIRYRWRNGRIWLGTNAYFFEEGSADRYAGARFGEFRLDRESGEAVLVGLCDGNLQAL